MRRVLPFLFVTLPAAAAFAQGTLPVTEPVEAISTGVVTEKTESNTGLSIRIDGGSRVLTTSGDISLAGKKAFRLLQVGRAYSFPNAFYTPVDDTEEYTQIPLAGLENRAPFRALVDRVESGADFVSLRLSCADGNKIHYLHTGAADVEKAKALVAPLRQEEVYEFPAVLLGRQPPPAPPGGEPLDLYVGDWRGTLDGDPGYYITMRCAWRCDGQGMWREIMYDDSTGADPVHDVAVLTVDAAGGKFLANDPRDSNKLPASSTYDAATKTFTTRLPAFQAGVVRSNTATFTDANTITWRTLTRTEAGAVLSTTSGTYKRLVKPQAPPPASAASPLAAAAPAPAAEAPPMLSLGAPLPPAPPEPNELLKLGSLPPFRATVLKKQILEERIELELRITNCAPVIVAHNGTAGRDQALAVAGRLQEGTTYEFPDVLTAAVQPQPPSDVMSPLAPLIGSWRDPNHVDPQNLTRYFWKSDGTGLWREVSLLPALQQPNDEPGKQVVTATLITYNPATKAYAESLALEITPTKEAVNGSSATAYVLSQPKSPARESQARWDPATQTYTWSDVRDQPVPGVKYSGSRRLISKDRIEWLSKVTAPDGKELQERAGYYERVKP